MPEPQNREHENHTYDNNTSNKTGTFRFLWRRGAVQHVELRWMCIFEIWVLAIFR
jgi:hypothetical protein